METQDTAEGCFSFISILIVIGLLAFWIFVLVTAIDAKAICAASGYPQVTPGIIDIMSADCVTASGDHVPLSDLKTWK